MVNRYGVQIPRINMEILFQKEDKNMKKKPTKNKKNQKKNQIDSFLSESLSIPLKAK